jgi:hypothetical protein
VTGYCELFVKPLWMPMNPNSRDQAICIADRKS